tara:strand:+ start:1000 stop:1230 length:231 start_codon:yes stop_codon:yes gene_type:complete
LKAKNPNYRVIYIVRYEDLELEYCAFYNNVRNANKGKTTFKREFEKCASIEKIEVPYSKKGFIDIINKYGIKYRKK